MRPTDSERCTLAPSSDERAGNDASIAVFALNIASGVQVTGPLDRTTRDTDTGAWKGMVSGHKASPDDADGDGASMNDARSVARSPGDGSADDETADDRCRGP
ncbi:MAG: hypothetical protein ABI277_02200 [Burkholderiaceae bacterium]